MNKYIKTLFISLFAIPLVGCGSSSSKVVYHSVLNGGFETSDLSGWTVEYGDAYTDDSVSSRTYFTFDDDVEHNRLDIKKTGNWYLSGQGYDLAYSHGRIGSIRSNNFYLDNDGLITVKLAGGATRKGKYDDSPLKNEQEICYFGVYLASSDQMIAKQTNKFFKQHIEYVEASKYNNNYYNTDNFYEYTIDLEEYANQEVYVRVVDNDKDVYYGYLSVDDIRVGYVGAQTEGAYYTKTREYIDDVEAIDKYHIKNPDFEIGSLGGWTVVEGEAFSNEGVNVENGWWNEYITYNKDGKYHYGHYKPSATGILRSSIFELGGKGFISFKLGGCMEQALTYIRFMAVNGGEPIEVARVSNVQYKNEQFPFIPMKMHLLNMVQYYIDLGEYVGEDLYIEIVDNNTSSDDLGCMTFDSFETFYLDTPYWEDKEYYKIDIASTYEREPVNEYQPFNGTFETGDLTGWTLESSNGTDIGVISSKSYWWNNPRLTFNKRGTYFFSGENNEAGTGTLTSSSFKVGGVGYMTFRMSGARDPLSIYVSIIDASTNEELLRFTNFMFNDLDDETERVGHGENLMNMIFYKADLTSLLGEEVKIQVVDNATSNWGLVCVDSFITYYESMSAIDSSALLNPNALEYKESVSEYQVTNGTFETGDMSGWVIDGDPILGISRDYTWWHECFLYNKQGSYFLNGWVAGEESVGALTSSSFTLGGSGFVSYRLGGGKNKELCHIEFIDANTGDVLATTYNQKFKEITKSYYYLGYPKDLALDGFYAANMAEYKVDLSEFIGRHIQIRIVDNATDDWGLLFADDFITYYESSSDIPSNYVLAEKVTNE